MKTPITFAFAVLACFLQPSCSSSKPSADDAEQAIKEYYAAQRQPTKDVTIIRLGESGKGDFSARGSQDTYWPVEFDLPAEKVIDAGPLQVSAAGGHGVAQIYRDKMGRWKVARMER